MKFVKNDLSEDFSQIEIEIFSDLHIGSKRCDFKTIQQRVERVKANENVFAIILGDVCNTALKNSKSDVYEEALKPKEQLNQACMLFEPIKDKILGICQGNHENRIDKETNIDILYLMARQLGIENKYGAVSCLLFIRFGKQKNNKKARSYTSGRKLCYSLYMTHGSGGGGTTGAKANQLEKRGNIVDSDIVCIGHTHLPLTFRTASYKCDPQNNSAYLKEQVFVNASATLDPEDYAEKVGLRPSSKTSPVIILDGHYKNVLVRL